MLFRNFAPNIQITRFMTYDPNRQKTTEYLKMEFDKMWHSAREEKAGELHRTKRLYVEDMTRLIHDDGLIYRLTHCPWNETEILSDCIGRFFGSTEERTEFFIAVFCEACQNAKVAEAHVVLAKAIRRSTQAGNGLSGTKQAIKALEESSTGSMAA